MFANKVSLLVNQHQIWRLLELLRLNQNPVDTLIEQQYQAEHHAELSIPEVYLT